MNDAERTAELIRRNHELLRQAKEARDEVRNAVESTAYALALVTKARLQRRRQREVLQRPNAVSSPSSE